ncbi:hypothetical protein EV356DRAFT_180234 [Viridothelium virens]|uniref:Uncharacterized protein n=1 Tax=Viridothelium virens TaxID=1048519 RepID=A0A6A6H8K1_VIRVR|nr:hypothetical protein EV356DRAFT_180234 [Viridothelium virens]
MPHSAANRTTRRNVSLTGGQQGERSGRSKEKEVVSREGSSSTSLTRGRLARHDERVYPRDQHYTQNVILDEQLHDYYRASHRYLHQDEPEEDLLSDAGASRNTAREVDPSVEQNLGLHHRPLTSSQPPLKRFATIDGANEPFPTYVKRSMSDTGIGFGDMEGVQRREENAELLSNEVLNLKRTNSTSTGRITAFPEKRTRLQPDSVSEQVHEREEGSPEH